MTWVVRNRFGFSHVNRLLVDRSVGVCVVLLVAAVAWAQAPVGTISGTVRDQTDAVVPGASITIRNLATGAERYLVASQDGDVLGAGAAARAITA